MLGDQRVNDAAQRTIQSAWKIAHMYLVNSKSQIMRAVVSAVGAVSFWLLALILVSLLIRDSVYSNYDVYALGRLGLWSVACLLAAFLNLHIFIGSFKVREKEQETPAPRQLSTDPIS